MHPLDFTELDSPKTKAITFYHPAPVSSVTRHGDFLKLVDHKFYLKCSPIFSDFLGYFGKHHFLSKAYCGYLLGNVLNYLGYP